MRSPAWPGDPAREPRADGERSANRTFHGINQIARINNHITVAYAAVRDLTDQFLSDEEQERVTTFLSDVMAEFLPNAERLSENDLSLVVHNVHLRGVNRC